MYLIISGCIGVGWIVKERNEATIFFFFFNRKCSQFKFEDFSGDKVGCQEPKQSKYFFPIKKIKCDKGGWDAENQNEAETCQRVVRRSVEWQ